MLFENALTSTLGEQRLDSLPADDRPGVRLELQRS